MMKIRRNMWNWGFLRGCYWVFRISSGWRCVVRVVSKRRYPLTQKHTVKNTIIPESTKIQLTFIVKLA